MASDIAHERHLVGEIAGQTRWGKGAPDEAERLEKVRRARLILRSTKARRKASEWLQIASEAEAELASGNGNTAA
jgi:hypothetical protein